MGAVAGEDDVAVEEAHGFVGDGFVDIVSGEEDGEEGGDAAAFIVAGAFEKAREFGEDRGGVALAAGGFARGEADFAECAGEAGDGVHQEDDVLAARAGAFCDGEGGVGGFEAEECGFVGG